MLQFTKFLQEFPQRIWSRRGLDCLLAKFINIGQQKEFQAVGDRTLLARLITLIRLKSWFKAKWHIYLQATDTPYSSWDSKGDWHPSFQRSQIVRKDSALKCIKPASYDSLQRTRNYCVDGSICHFKFPNVVLEHYIRRSGHFMHSFVKCLSRDMPTDFYWKRFIFDKHRAKEKLARFYWDTV